MRFQLCFLTLVGVVAMCATSGPQQAVVGQPREQSSSGAHDYFDRVRQRPDHLVSYSLRDPSQLNHPKSGGFAHSNTRPLGVSYAPASDTFRQPQDAAKILIPAGKNNLQNQLRLPLQHGPEGFMLTWDTWWGREFAYENAGIRNYKAFQLESGDRIWTEVRARFRGARKLGDAIALVDVRPYGGSAERKGSALGDVNYGSGSLGGLLEHFPIAPDTWTRYWVRLVPRKDASGRWWDFSLWLADEKRDPIQLYSNEGITPNGPDGWQRFWIEFNTSTSKTPIDRGDLVAYVRNVVVLRGPGLEPHLFERP